MNILIDQVAREDLICKILTQGFLLEEHTVFSRYGGKTYDGCPLDLVITTDGSTFDFAQNTPRVHVGTLSNPVWPFSSIHSNLDSIYGICTEYFHSASHNRNSLLNRRTDICVLSEEANPSFECLATRFPYGNLIRVNGDYDCHRTVQLADSKVIVVPKTLNSNKDAIWKAMASGGIMVVERLNTYSSFPPITKKHALPYSDHRELIMHVSDVLREPLQFQHIADIAWNSGKKFHTSRIRARQFLTYALQKPQQFAAINNA